MQASLNGFRFWFHRSVMGGLMLWGILVGLVCHSQVLTRTDAVQQALAANFQIRVARTEVQVAREGNTSGFAGALPQVTANLNPNLTVANQSLEFVSGETRSAAGALTTNLGASIQLNWTLFDGFNMFATKDLLNLGVAGAELQARARVEAVVAEVYSVYARLVALEQLQDVVRAVSYTHLTLPTKA
jgi:outer membrane protein TolC